MHGMKNIWEKKLLFIAKILGNLQEDVANAPAPTSPDDEDTYETRSFNLWAQETLLEEA